jgi:hypothetical protein
LKRPYRLEQAERLPHPPTPLAAQLVKKEAASPRRRPLCIKEETPRQPILKTLQQDPQILIANCVQARANLRLPAELSGVLQVGHCATKQGWSRKRNAQALFNP